MQIAETIGFSETFLFLRDYILEKENTHIPKSTTRFLFLELRLHFRTSKSTRHSTTTRYYNSRTFSHVTLQQLGSACTLLGFLGNLLQLDRPEAMTKYKLVIPTKGIMILVFWDKSFKSMEADYSNHLASPLVASSGETSPSPRIRL